MQRSSSHVSELRFGSPLQGSVIRGRETQGVALGWYRPGLQPNGFIFGSWYHCKFTARASIVQ
jgi:hypothetical protein